MRRTLLIGAALVLLAGLAGLGAAYAHEDGRTIRLTGKLTSSHELDLGEKGPSVFDQSIFTGDVFDRSGRKVGHEAGHCTAVTPLAFDPPAGLVCNTIVVLEHGQIVFTGLFRVADFSPSSEFRTPVVGGTGAYRAAAGQGIVKESSAEDWELTIHLE